MTLLSGSVLVVGHGHAYRRLSLLSAKAQVTMIDICAEAAPDIVGDFITTILPDHLLYHFNHLVFLCSHVAASDRKPHICKIPEKYDGYYLSEHCSRKLLSLLKPTGFCM